MNLEKEALIFLSDETFNGVTDARLQRQVAELMTDFYKHQFKKDIESLTDEMVEVKADEYEKIQSYSPASIYKNEDYVAGAKWAKQHYLKLNK